MTKAELIEIIKEAFGVFKSDKNRAFPKYFGLTETLDGIVNTLEIIPGDGDLSAILAQIQELRDLINAIHPGLSEAEVQAKIDAALVRIDTAIAALQAKDASQDTEIQNLEQEVNLRASKTDLAQLEGQVNGLITDFDEFKTADAPHEADQDQKIQQLRTDVDALGPIPDLTGLTARVDQLRTDLNANQGQDDQQEVKIQQLRTDVDALGPIPDLTDLTNKVSQLRTDLDANGQHDGLQDTDLQHLKDQLNGLPTKPEFDDLKSKVSQVQHGLADNDRRDGIQDGDIQNLKTRLEILNTNLLLNDRRDEKQEEDIQKIQNELPNKASRDDLNRNNIRDDNQDTKIRKLEELIALIPIDPDLSAIWEALRKNNQRDDGQDILIAKIEAILRNLPTPPNLDDIRRQIADLQRDLTQNNLLDDRQQAAILALQTGLANTVTKTELGQVRADLIENNQRDNRQDTDINKLKQDVAGAPSKADLDGLKSAINVLDTKLLANGAIDAKQEEAIKKLQQAIQGIPTDANLDELWNAVHGLNAAFTSHKNADDARDARQDADLKILNNWRIKTIEDLTAIQQQLDGLTGGGPDLEGLRTELLGVIQQLEEKVDAGLLPLEGLPQKVSELEQRLNNLQPGIDEATATGIAEAKVNALRDAVEIRLVALEGKTAGIDDLATRLGKAEQDISKLFELVAQGGGGGTGNTGGVNEAYVQAELRKLETTLRGEINAIDAKYAGLLALAADVENLKTELAKKTTVGQVQALIAAAVAGLASNQALLDLEATLNLKITTELQSLQKSLTAAIKAAYEAYVQEQVAGFDRKIAAAETRLREELADKLREALAKFWEQLPDQPFPAAWLEQALTEAGKLDAALKTEILAQAKSWDDALRNELSQAAEDLQTTILAEVAAIYALKTELKAEKQFILGELERKLAELAATITPSLTPEEVKTLANAEAARLDGLLDQRIADLEGLNLDQRLVDLETFQTQIQNLKLEEFKTYISSLNLGDIVSLVYTINNWKETTQPQIQDLTEQIAAIREDLENSPASDGANRLSRICLTGWGLIGGLEIFTDKDYCILVSPGEGITPDGHQIIVPEERSFLGYYALPDSERTTLDPAFFDGLRIWGLIESKDENTIDNKTRRWLPPQTNQERDMPFIFDKVLLLVPGPRFLLVQLDEYLKKTGNFDRVRQLMGAQRNLEFSDFLFTARFSPADNQPTDDILYRAFRPEWSLPSIHLYRFGFRPDEDCTPEELDNTEFPQELIALHQIYDTWKPIIDEALNGVNSRIATLIKNYHPLLFPQLDASRFQEVLDILLSNWKAFTTFAERSSAPDDNQPEKCFAQYYYDWARDLINAYHECRDELQDLMAELCLLTPETLSDRRQHLALGLAYRPDQDGLAAPLRDTYHQPPIYNGNAARWEKTRFYYRRLFELIESFYIRDAVPEDYLPEKYRREDEDPFEPDFSKLRITPGKNLGHPLGLQAIPFYYPMTDGPGSLHYFWDYRRTKSRSYDQHLSYHASDGYDGFNNPNDWHIIRPLYFTLDRYDFYRVEGHINCATFTIDGYNFDDGKNDEKNIVGAIRYLVRKHNLDFEVVAKRINKADSTTNLAQPYLQKTPAEVIINSFRPDMLGAEHLGGVPKGGTFIVILDENDVAVADFSLPYRWNGATVPAVPPLDLEPPGS